MSESRKEAASTRPKRFKISRLTVPEPAVLVEFSSEQEFLRFINDVEEKVAFESVDALFYFVNGDAVFCCKKRGLRLGES